MGLRNDEVLRLVRHYGLVPDMILGRAHLISMGRFAHPHAAHASDREFYKRMYPPTYE